jgi:hypothetical protein
MPTFALWIHRFCIDEALQMTPSNNSRNYPLIYISGRERESVGTQLMTVSHGVTASNICRRILCEEVQRVVIILALFVTTIIPTQVYFTILATLSRLDHNLGHPGMSSRRSQTQGQELWKTRPHQGSFSRQP